VEGPIASLLTSLVPLYLLVLGRLFLGEALTGRKVAGLLLGLSGVALIATARKGGGESRLLPVVLTSMAPLSWAVYTSLTRPVMGTRSPLLWTYLVLAAGGTLLLPFLGFLDRGRVADLGGLEWGLIAYLVVPTTLAGFAVWSWLLRQLPAGTVGLTTFLNPPLTLGWKSALALLFPATFALSLAPREWLGGGLALAGVGVVVLGRGGGRDRAPGSAAESSGLPRRAG
jgi:drug/metabolite transporter (DMT)-like permease